MADDWRSPSKRQTIIQKLEETLGGNPSAGRQNPTEMEKALFEKSKSKDEYMSYFHNVILMLTRQKQQAMISGARPNPSMMGMGGQPMGMNQPAPGYQQTYSQFPNTNMMQVPSNPGYGGPQIAQQPPQYHPGGMYPQGQGGNQNPGMLQPRYAGNMNMSQGYVPQNRHNYAGHNMGVVNNAGSYSGGGMYNQSMIPGGQGPMSHGNMMRPVMRQPGMVGPRPGMQGQQIQPQAPPFMNEGVVGQPVQSVPNPSYASSIRPLSGANPVYSSGIMTSAGNQVPSTSMPPSSTGNPSMGGAANASATQHPTQAPSINNPPTPHPSSLQGPVPSPAPPTPLYPASPATSGVGSPATQHAMTPEENEAYIRKLGELQKYIPLLSKWISKVSNDDRKGDQYIKLKSLFNLLRDSNRRVPLATLKKCEIALERMFDSQSVKENSDSSNSSHHPKNPSLPPSSASSSSSSSFIAPPEPTVPEPKFSNPPQSQSLLDFKMVLSPPATCTNLMDTIQPHPFPSERLPAAKRMCVTEDSHLPPSLTKEIAYLKQFNIKVVPNEGSKFNKSTAIQCLLMDENIPVVPALAITLPSNYPQLAPICDLSHYLDSTSPFLVEVGNLLSEKLSKKNSLYSLSALLDYWEMAILRAMAKELLAQEE